MLGLADDRVRLRSISFVRPQSCEWIPSRGALICPTHQLAVMVVAGVEQDEEEEGLRLLEYPCHRVPVSLSYRRQRRLSALSAPPSEEEKQVRQHVR